MRLRLIILLGMLLASACQSTGGDDGPDADTDSDTASTSESYSDTRTPAPPIQALDLLFMVDNSNSMREEQANLTSNFPAFLTALGSASDVHVGVVSSDMGSAGYPVTTCGTLSGDDG